MLFIKICCNWQLEYPPEFYLSPFAWEEISHSVLFLPFKNDQYSRLITDPLNIHLLARVETSPKVKRAKMAKWYEMMNVAFLIQQGAVPPNDKSQQLPFLEQMWMIPMIKLKGCSSPEWDCLNRAGLSPLKPTDSALWPLTSLSLGA